MKKFLVHPLKNRGCISIKCKFFQNFFKKVRVFQKKGIYLRRETIFKI
jgi:hypothetical protein